MQCNSASDRRRHGDAKIETSSETPNRNRKIPGSEPPNYSVPTESRTTIYILGRGQQLMPAATAAPTTAQNTRPRPSPQGRGRGRRSASAVLGATMKRFSNDGELISDPSRTMDQGLIEQRLA